MRVVAYIRVDPGEGEDGGAFWHAPDGESQTEAVEAWARANGHAIAKTSVERTRPGLDQIGERVGFLAAMTHVRNGEADLICVAALERLDEDLVVQELLIAEARRSRVAIASARADDQLQMSDPPGDPTRAVVRRAIEQSPVFQGEMRSLRAGVRRLESGAGLDQLAPALSELESVQAHGPSDRLVQARPHRIARWLKNRRTTG